MPHDVTMPQLGMAQDTGRIVSWLKASGQQVTKGEALFEVETDKATMEVEAPADGFLANILAGEGDDVPVGQVIARISESLDDTPAAEQSSPSKPSQAEGGPLPEGKEITMPQLGMAQDTGLLVRWLKSPGDAVDADDVLFEVETDKSTIEVPAGVSGYLAATLAQAGEEVPVGVPLAIISETKPASSVARSFKETVQPVAEQQAAPATPAPEAPPVGAASTKRPLPPKPLPVPGERVLASPKARRLALEEGLDLADLVEAGCPQPYSVRDLDTLRAMPAKQVAQSTTGVIRLTAEIPVDGLTSFAAWAADAHSLEDDRALLAGLAGASLSADGPVTVAIERFETTRSYTVPQNRSLSQVSASDERPDLILRDLRGTPLRSVEMGSEEVPVVTVTSSGAGLSITLEGSRSQLEPQGATALLTRFAGRMEQPLRHLL